MKRREFIKLLGGSTLWPLAAHAQQPDRTRRIAVLMTVAEDNPDGKPRLEVFVQGLQELGWTDGRNIRIDYRWSAGDAERTRKYAAELVSLAPDVILAGNRISRPCPLLAQSGHAELRCTFGVRDPDRPHPSGRRSAHCHHQSSPIAACLVGMPRGEPDLVGRRRSGS